jgi:hypothetical protein
MRNEASTVAGHVSGRWQAGWHALIRTMWALLLALPVGLFVFALPYEVDRLHLAATQAGGALPVSAATGPLTALLDPVRYTVLTSVLEVALMAAFATAAVAIGWWAPYDRMALFVSVTLVSFGALSTPALDSLVAAQPHWDFPARLVRAIGLECEVLIFYISPNGRFFPRWTRPLAVVWTVWRLVTLATPTAFITFVTPGLRIPVGTPSPLVLLVLFAAYLFWIGSALLAQIVRYRTASTLVQRQQTKWAMIAVVVAVLAYVAYVLPQLGLKAPGLGALSGERLVYRTAVLPLYLIILFLLPVAITFSMLRFRLWNVDVVIQRTLLYTSLTGTLVAIYLGSVVVLQDLFRALTGQTSSISIVVSTLAIAVLFHPLRERIQRTIDRRFYRRRYDAARALAAMGQALQHEVDLSRISDQLVEIVDRTMHPTHISLWLRDQAPESAPDRPS